MSDKHVRYLLVSVLVFVAQASENSYLADFWHHLARGEVILQSGELLDHDIFTFTVSGTPFQDVNWLSQCIYAQLFALGGLALVQTVNALILALALGWLVHLCRHQSGSQVLGMAVGLLVFLGLWQVLTIRPQTFSILLFVAFLAVLFEGVRDERDARTRNRRTINGWLIVLGLPLLQALWTNLHGAFPMGIALAGCFGLAELLRCLKERRWSIRLTLLSACLAFCVAATLVNPYGVDIYRYVGVTSQRAKERRIDEWLPPSLDQAIGIAFFASLAVLAIVLVLAWQRRRFLPRLEEAVLLLCFLPLALFSVRMVAWWLLVAALPLSRALAVMFPQAADKPEASFPKLSAGITVIVLCLLALFSTPWLSAANPLLAAKQQPRIEQHLDAALAHFEKTHKAGRVFTRLEWGEYIGYRGRPAFPVFMDGRIEIYPDEVWQAYADITQARDDWQKRLNDCQANILLLDRDYHGRLGLLDAVEKSGHWRKAFESGPVVAYERATTGTE